jgi:hypothetical protein
VSERYELAGVFSRFFSFLEHEPGPKIDKRTGRRKMPCTAPRRITKKTILKKVIKM